MGRRLDRYAQSSKHAAEEFAAPHSTSRCYSHELRGDHLVAGADLDLVDRSVTLGKRYRARTSVATVAFRSSRGRPKTLIVARRAEAEFAYHDG
jgi:hypothetical protein